MFAIMLTNTGAWAQQTPIDVSVGEDAVTICNITIANPFPDTVTLADIAPDCPTCVRVALSPTDFPPQQSLSIPIEIDARLRTSVS